jgi:nitric oxide reductase NorD protein
VGTGLAHSLPEALLRLPADKRGGFGRIVRRVIAERPTAAPMVAEQLPGLLAELSEADAAAFVSRALQLFERSEAKAHSFLRRETEAGQQTARQVHPGVAFEDVQRLMALYARAHCGADIELAAGAGEARLDVTGGRLVATVPARVDTFGDRRDFLAWRVLVARCAGYVEFGSLAIDVGRLCAGFTEPALALELYRVLEDARVERQVRREYPGLDRDLLRLHRQRPPVRGQAAVDQFVEALRHHAWDLPLPHELLGPVLTAVEPLIPRMDAVVRGSALDVAAALPEFYAAAARFVERSPEAPVPMPPMPGGGIEPPEGDAGDDAGGSGSEDAMPADPLEAEAWAAAAARSRRPTAEYEQMDAWVSAARGFEPPTRDPGAAGEAASFEYPEWDFRVGDYKPRWVRVVEHPVDGEAGTFVADVRRRHGPLIRRLRRAFEAMRPEASRRQRGLVDGEDLDIDAAIESRVVHRAGGSASDRIYVRRLPLVRDVAAAFLVDLSSSTSEIVNTEGQRIIEVEKEALVCIAEALEAIGDRFAIHGFSGYGRDHVAFYVAKDFDEPLTDVVRDRIGAMRWKMENRDGAAIRHCTRRLLEVSARRRLLFLLSDGRPLDCGCDQYFDRYAWQDTRMALREARRAGIHAFCTTVDPRGADYLEAMYGRGAYAVVERVEALPSRLIATYKRLTR